MAYTQNQNTNLFRDVRTLLLCKIQKNYAKHYDTLYAPPAVKSRSFMTIGGFDAVNIYPTMPEPISTQPGWSQLIYQDKEAIIQNMNEDISYHPIHLVTYSKSVKSFWNSDTSKYPYFVLTFVYGIDKNKYVSENPENIEHLDQSTSVHERRLQNYLLQKALDNDKVIYAVYHAVNLCDLVIVWYTSDIQYTLNAVASIEEDGIARKTFTTIGLSLDGNTISPSSNAIPDDKSCPFILRISGKIRDYSKFIDIYSRLTLLEGLGLNLNAPHGSDAYATYGENDFCIDTKPVNTKLLTTLFEFWLSAAEEWSDACWEIHTDILCRKNFDPTKNYPKANPISDILVNQYKKYHSAFSTTIKKYPWASTLLELLCVYVNIDRNPVLHGPGYLVHGCLSIANSYFCGEVPDFEKNSQNLEQLLHDSQETIERFIRNWSQLTDQVTRIDDVILHGLGNIVAINNTLPEFIMDCYHSLMHELVDLLVHFDHFDNRLDGINFEYDFLFVPELNQRMRISKMFNTKGNYQSNSAKRQIWPAKQAYLMEFPTKYIYYPKSFFVQLAHECFHCFGDSLRLRSIRADNMVCYVAAHFMSALGFEDAVYEPLFSEIANKLAITDDDISGEFYLDEVTRHLYIKVQQLASKSGLSEIYHSANKFFYLYADDSLEKWITLERHFMNPSQTAISLSDIVFSCNHYFKECYADAMAIFFLGLSANEYASLFVDEFSSQNCLTTSEDSDTEYSSNGYMVAQRIAIVLASCEKSGMFTQEQCRNALDEVYRVQFHEIYSATISCFETLCDENAVMPEGKWYHPTLALCYVVDYISKTIENIKHHKLQNQISREMEQFSNHFRSIIQQENLFGREFYEVIDKGHNVVKQVTTS